MPKKLLGGAEPELATKEGTRRNSASARQRPRGERRGVKQVPVTHGRDSADRKEKRGRPLQLPPYLPRRKRLCAGHEGAAL